jgi:polar amino acid transport system ATP-binding protein
MSETNSVLAAVEEITKGFSGRLVLDRISHAVYAGRHELITGPSGCGKTTFMRILALLEPADSGQIRYRDTNVTRYTRDPTNAQNRARLKVGYVSQERDLWPHLSVRDNLMLAFRLHNRRAEGERALTFFAESLHIMDHLDQYPGQLSGGQSQRCAIARCAMHMPELMLMDESLANLDDVNIGRVFSVVEELIRSGSTIILISHRLDIPTSLFTVHWKMAELASFRHGR